MSKSEIGLIGLGTMGAMLSLNIAEKGFAISVFNRTTSRTSEFHAEAGELAEQITPCDTLEDLVASIAEPRAIILMVPAGGAVDEQIAALRPLLGKDDLIIDAGNANFRDTEARAAQAEADGVPFLGIGVSGGEEGARHGPSIMGGGRKKAWDQVSHILTAIAADYEGTACATWMGQGGAGHFVKAVHNGIEYADMQMIAEIYGIMRDGQGADAATCAEAFETWNKGPLQSYLIEISGKVAAARDAETGNAVLDIILDRAGQKGTGRWTVIEAQHLGAPIPVIEAAVAARNLSAMKSERERGEATFGAAPVPLPTGALGRDDLEQALIAGKIMCYAQGFHLLNSASAEFEWDLPMPEIARVWREGCIIRSTMLNDMAEALTGAPQDNLMFAPFFAKLIDDSAPALRRVVATAVSHGLQVPALAAGLSYYDAMRTGRSTANMIQAQRDFFGAHSFERVDKEGAHHGPWGS
ncbi:6-phosphogluconate dehydrogenase (decarboxylating) [Litoreibacter halocynthiae]|uniref:6-phosphogluconate dehydrogenase, decarboxylating n=1 Tax=Litoreibacter halocynthiae TaxID=1242689 RepID=A0A4V3EW46_9RHOB|nr:NADP-dependent phosphogluconate dehydrogenase [Litoreibacter halocynthiae]TDT75555.1 6-phosphogluconate dehydrogenase (decarboxylating) [Litoreibacter halocynthiae]